MFSSGNSLARRIPLLTWLLMACVTSERLAADDASSPSLPHYKLHLGQQLKYEGQSESKTEEGSRPTVHHCQATVVRENPDGTCRVFFRFGEPKQQGIEHPADVKVPEDVYFGLADVDSSGNAKEVLDSYGNRISPQGIFPRLPATVAELTGGWQAEGSFDSVQNCHAVPNADSNLFEFEVVSESPIYVIYGVESQSTIIWDRQQGLMQETKSTLKQTYGIKQEVASEMKLTDSKMLEPEVCKQLADDAELFFAAREKFSSAIGAEDATAKSLVEAVEELKSTKDKIASKEFHEQIDHLIDDFQKYRKYTEQELADRQSLLGQPAEEFKTTDLDDKPQALADYRGKVVLLDFWYRGCGWCIRAMPQLKEVADHYRDKPVALLGMNTDHDVEDAKFVVDKLGLNYTNLKAEGLPEKFKVHGFPTMILIDQQGKIRDIHSGWTPTLRDDLIKKIDRLLAESQ